MPAALAFRSRTTGASLPSIGLFGILVQALLIAHITRSYGTRRLIPVSILINEHRT